MGLFDKFKKSMGFNDDLESIVKKNSATAVNYAKRFQKNFDYSSDSIKDLEEILNYYSNDVSKSHPTENQIWSMAVIFGTYLGEVMLNNGLLQKGFFWGTDGTSNIPLLSDHSGSHIAPIDKIYKRLVNGTGDSAASFYGLIMKAD